MDAFIAFVTLGLSTLSWVYAAEVFPDAIRGRAMAVATFVFWGWTFAGIELYDTAAARLSVPGVLGLFAGFCSARDIPEFCQNFDRMFRNSPASRCAS